MKKSEITLIVMFLIGSLIISGNIFISSAATEPEFKLIHASVNPPTHIENEIHLDFINRIERLSNGRIKYEFYPSAVLGDEVEMMEGIQTGAITTARLTGAPLGAISNGYMIVNLPFLFSDSEHMLNVVRSTKFAKLTEDELIKEGIRPLEFWWMGIRDLYTKKPVKNIEDVKGMKIRTWQDRYVLKAWEKLGVIPTPISFSELYTALQTGIVDGGEGWAASYNARGFYEHAPYLTKIGYINIFSAFVISEKIWKQLPSDLQDVMKQAASENAEFAYEVFKNKKDEIYETARKKGATVIEVKDIEKWQSRIEPIYKEFGEEFGQDYADLINWIISTR